MGILKRVYNNVGEEWQIGYQEQATPISAGIVDLHNTIMYYIIIIITFVIYIIIARIKSNRSINWIRNKNHSTTIELIWTIVPGLLLIIIAIPSLKLLYSMDEIIKPNVTLKAIGSQWFWSYEISDIEGLEINFDSYTKTESDLEIGELRLLDVDNRVLLPILTPIRLLVTAQDVIHSFYIPSFGVKIDAIPGRINHSSIYILKEGTYYGSCTELCGSGHERMSIVVEGVTTNNYLSWLSTMAN